ncbi:hypothetical protein [Streptococcus dysgalactiae]|uniref:hypothetical protein n=1 Tax=Streptococcus dysgalactiae TaxID=1334 RepID=UPI001CF31B02|nr:hypothetical protein [Streptococcus dysgalactiae]MCB2832811.1 hypothetical protein [Streptococcus dysgalactiae subsp. dysgalactiae]MCB2840412.1 hypothetical protein [Streptococcus dysgalactiae subsp. dysgalactiae]MCB2844233.1 hypothetical protein [Streptococcus dysgalactiae subsp. dysgalactiae]
MISYEKVRQALKTSTIAIIILNGLGVVLSLMGFAGIFYLQSQLKNEEFRSQFTAEQLAQMQSTMTPFMIFLSVLNVLAIITIIVFCAQNLSKLKQGLTVSYIPYILGLILSVTGLVSQFTTSLSMVGTILILAQAALYGFAFYKAKTLNEKDTDIDQDQTIL